MSMAVSLSQVYSKANAYVDALCKLPRSVYAAAPSGHYARDYNTLRKLALEVLAGIDGRLLGKYISVRPAADGRELCDATFVEIETYARQIMQQLAAALGQPALRQKKGYQVAAIRREYNQAYRPWSEQDDEYLRTRFLEGATVDDLVNEFARQPGGIRSRLRKLGLDPRNRSGRFATNADASTKATGTRPADTSWRRLRPRAGRVWTPDEDALLLRELAAGSSLKAIAQSLGRGVFSVEVRLCKLRASNGTATPKRDTLTTRSMTAP
jgi:hypothetical protein